MTLGIVWNKYLFPRLRTFEACNFLGDFDTDCGFLVNSSQEWHPHRTFGFLRGMSKQFMEFIMNE